MEALLTTLVEGLEVCRLDVGSGSSVDHASGGVGGVLA